MPSAAVRMGGPQAQEGDPLPCPRCSSTNTKFCYYNNYNFSQPRHFCKSCRRYWTHGGTLRDIPVGGGSRKSAKRSRTSAASSAASTASVSLSSPSSAPAAPPAHLLTPLPSSGNSFTSLLSGGVGPGFFGFGLGLGLEDVGFGRGVWPFPEVGFLGSAGSNLGSANSGFGAPPSSDGASVSRGDTWHVETGDNSFADCFPSLPDLAISTPGNGLK